MTTAMAADLQNCSSCPDLDLDNISILSYAFIGVVMFGIGAGVKLAQLREIRRSRKSAFAVGLMSQYLIVPAAARAIVTWMDLPDMDAFGVLLLGCCPGGAISNAFAYFAKGDLAMSVSMTAVSNLLAFGTLPFLLWAWTLGLDTRARIPYLQIFGSLLLALVPASMGGVLRHRSELWGRRAEKFGAASGVLIIVGMLAAGLVQNSGTMDDPYLLPWRNAIAVALVAPIGMLFALAAMRLLRKWQGQPVPLPVLATVVLETGVQNSALALAIANLTTSDTGRYSRADAFRLQFVCILWGIIVGAEALLVVLAFRVLISRERAAGEPAMSKATEQSHA